MTAPRTLLRLALCLAVLAACAHALSPRRMEDFRRRVPVYDVITVDTTGHVSRTAGVDRNGHAIHREYLRTEFSALGEHFVLDLQRNDRLVSRDYVEERVRDNGEIVVTRRGAELCHYHGVVANALPGQFSSVAVSTCEGLHGGITVGDDTYFIEPAHRRLEREAPGSGRHVVYRVRDVVDPEGEAPATCGVDHDHEVLSNELNEFRRMAESSAEDNDDDDEGGEDALSRRQHASENWVEVSLANDNRRYRDHGANTETHTLTIFNIVTGLYSDARFDPIVRAILIRQRTFEGGNEFTVVSNANTLLDNWCSYRRTTYNYGDNGVFFSGLDFDGSTIGLAWVGTMCSSQNSCNVNQESSLDHITAATITHEMGHNLNLPHDSTGAASRCPQSGYVMAAVACNNCVEAEWSSCSQDLISDFFDSSWRQLTCLTNEPETGWTRPECGNNILEEGEECDSQSNCCNPDTCQLASGAVCDFALNECCSSSCTFENGKPCGEGGRCYEEGDCITYDGVCQEALSGYNVGTVTGCTENNGVNNGCGYLECYISNFGGCTNLRNINANGLNKFAPDGTPCAGGYCENSNCVEYDPNAPVCPTPNGKVCNAHGTCSDGECTCTGGWTGDDCTTAPPCPKHNNVECNNHGNCVDGVCECTDNWTGDACQFVPQCPKVNGVDCNGQGQCISGVCQCEAAWQGSACDMPVCPGQPECSGRGTCTLDANDNPVCSCESNYKGAQCELVDCPGEPDCSNRGECRAPWFIWDASCVCEEGWEGADCSQCASGNTDPSCGGGGGNEETPRPITCAVPDCNGNGNCIVTGQTATCQCFSTWKGANCDINDCPGEPDCASQGTCIRQAAGFDPVCQCSVGWRGDDCAMIDCPDNPLCSTDGGDPTPTNVPPPTGDGQPNRLIVTAGPEAGTVLAENSFVEPAFKVRIVDAKGALVRDAPHTIGVLPSDESYNLGLKILGGGSRPNVGGEVTFDLMTVSGPRGATFKLKFFSIGLPVLGNVESVPLSIEPCPDTTAPMPFNSFICGCDLGYGGLNSLNCQQCPIGFFKSVVDNTLCEECPPTTSTPTSGSTSRDDCACRQFPGADPEVCTFVYEPVGPGGDEWTFPGVSVTVPPGAITGEKNISVVHVNSDDIDIPDHLALVSTVRKFGPSGAQFESPVMVTYEIFADQVTDWSKVAVYISQDGKGEWEIVESEPNQDDATCLGMMPHFTMAAAFELVGDPNDGDEDGSEFPTLIVVYSACGLIGAAAIGGGATYAIKRRRANRYKAFNDFGGSSIRSNASTAMTPMSSQRSAAPATGSAWVQSVAESGDPYWYNPSTGETTWTQPN